MPTIFIAVPGSTPQDAAAAADGRLFLATRTHLRAFGVTEGRLLWEATHPAPEPVFYRVPRRIRASGKILRPGEGGLLHLSDGETDVIVRCHDEMSGRVRWERRLPTPPALPWTEPVPACEGAQTEEIDAFLLREIPGLAVARTSRRSTHSLPGQGTFPAPPYQAQFEILSLEGDSGRDRWTATLPNIGVPILEKRRLTLLLRRGAETLEIAAETGVARVIGGAPKPCAWPRRAGGKAFAAWRTTKGFGLTAFDEHDVFLARKNTRDVTLHEAGSRLVLQFNERSFSVVQPDLSVGPEIPIKGYIYGCCRIARWPSRHRDGGDSTPSSRRTITWRSARSARCARGVSAFRRTSSWHAVVSLLRSAAIGRLKKTAAQRAAALIDEARIRVSVLAEQGEAQARLQAEHWVRTLRRAGEVIITTFDAQSLAGALVGQLPKLGIDCCYLSIFDEPLELSASLSAQTARLLLAYDAASGQPALSDARCYPARELVPRALLPMERPFTLVVEPLFFDELQLGFVTIGMGPRSGVVYEALRSQLATALKGGLLVAQVLEESRRRQIEEQDTRQAQKLESVGRLASGIAHEINTPVQFVSDSMHFVDEAFREMAALIARYRALREALASDPKWRPEALALGQAENDADLACLLENGPPAIERSLDGLARVTAIVRSMKEFAHPDQGEQAPADVNKAIENTLVIARNEYKYVADVKVELGKLPPVVCNLGELNQVILNLLVNAAQAIDDVVRGTGDKGLITVRTWQDGGDAVIAISDTGGGIPERIRERIFDPFFTTKEVGRGTGQGLAIARAAIVGKHGGALTFETELGRGTTFFVRLPVPQEVTNGDEGDVNADSSEVRNTRSRSGSRGD